MNSEKEAIVSFRVPINHKRALKSYCVSKGISESEWCVTKLLESFAVLEQLNKLKQYDNIRDRDGGA